MDPTTYIPSRVVNQNDGGEDSDSDEEYNNYDNNNSEK